MLANMTVDGIDPRSMNEVGTVSLGLLGWVLAWSMSKMGDGENSGHFILEGSDGVTSALEDSSDITQGMVRQIVQNKKTKCDLSHERFQARTTLNHRPRVPWEPMWI